ncbi:MAG: hypothetical protein OXO54_08515 [Chloroflexota bacterium]|nr:hypothetical protein [Chloroflexota bacterium]
MNEVAVRLLVRSDCTWPGGPTGDAVGGRAVAVGVGVGVGSGVGASRVVTSLGGCVHHPQLSGPLQAWMRNRYVTPACRPVYVWLRDAFPATNALLYGGWLVPFRQNSSPNPVSSRPPLLGLSHRARAELLVTLSNLTFGTMPGVPARVAPRVAADAGAAPGTPGGAPSGIASTVNAWRTETSAVAAPLGRTSAVSVPAPSAQA